MQYITTAEQAEENAATQMRKLGFPDARKTKKGADAGIDVISSRAIAQVKWKGAAAGRPELQNLYGARGNRHHVAMFFFTASGYSKQAVDYADSVAMQLFTFDPTGAIEPVNRFAQSYLDNVRLREYEEERERRRRERQELDAQLARRHREAMDVTTVLPRSTTAPPVSLPAGTSLPKPPPPPPAVMDQAQGLPGQTGGAAVLLRSLFWLLTVVFGLLSAFLLLCTFVATINSALPLAAVIMFAVLTAITLLCGLLCRAWLRRLNRRGVGRQRI